MSSWAFHVCSNLSLVAWCFDREDGGLDDMKLNQKPQACCVQTMFCS